MNEKKDIPDVIVEISGGDAYLIHVNKGIRVSIRDYDIQDLSFDENGDINEANLKDDICVDQSHQYYSEKGNV